MTAASGYLIYRSSNNSGFTLVGSPGTNSFTDSNLTSNTAYIYFALATDGSVVSLPSFKDLATTISFTDDPLVPGVTVVKAVHLQELRTAVDAVRAAGGLGPATYTDPVAAGAIIKAIDITELRSALDQARLPLGLGQFVYTDPSLAAGAIIKAAHVQELRDGVK